MSKNGPVKRLTNFNPRAPRGARPPKRANAAKTVLISIHVPREGHDALYVSMVDLFVPISIHVPREGHDVQKALLLCLLRLGFQSTCPARGTTNQDDNHGTCRKISIHVPREGHD